MKEYKNVSGTYIDGVPTIDFNIDTIYIRTNIKTDERMKNGYIYDEIQYTYNEYLEVLNSKVDKSNIEQETLILDNAYRVAVLEISTGATLNI